MKGTVVSGLKKGREFLLKKEYLRQINEKLGFVPYPGTLNIRVTKEILKDLRKIKEEHRIQGFTSKGTTYGDIKCYPGTIFDSHCVIIFPFKTTYTDIIEIIAEDNLREKYDINDNISVDIIFKPYLKRSDKQRFYALPDIGKKRTKVTIFYDAPFASGRRDLCYKNIMKNKEECNIIYQKTISEREIASVIFENGEKKAYANLMKFIENNKYFILSPIRKITYKILNEWQIELKTKQN
jgi:hypothetical protein